VPNITGGFDRLSIENLTKQVFFFRLKKLAVLFARLWQEKKFKQTNG